MNTYVVFDKQTGQIVHTHAEVSILGDPLLVSPDEVLAMHRGIEENERQDFGVLQIEPELLHRGIGGNQVYVDLKTGALVKKDAVQAEGGGK